MPVEKPPACIAARLLQVDEGGEREVPDMPAGIIMSKDGHSVEGL